MVALIGTSGVTFRVKTRRRHRMCLIAVVRTADIADKVGLVRCTDLCSLTHRLSGARGIRKNTPRHRLWPPVGRPLLALFSGPVPGICDMHAQRRRRGRPCPLHHFVLCLVISAGAKRLDVSTVHAQCRRRGFLFTAVERHSVCRCSSWHGLDRVPNNRCCC